MWDTCIPKSLLVLSVLTRGVKEPGIWGSLAYDASRPGPGVQRGGYGWADGRRGPSALGRPRPPQHPVQPRVPSCSVPARLRSWLPPLTLLCVLLSTGLAPCCPPPIPLHSHHTPLQVLLLPGPLPFLAQSCPSSEICPLQEAPRSLKALVSVPGARHGNGLSEVASPWGPGAE